MEALGAAILLAMAFVLVLVTARKSIAADEIVLIPLAYYHLITDDVQLIPQHPPLCELLAERLHHKKAHCANINCATQTLQLPRSLRGSNPQPPP